MREIVMSVKARHIRNMRLGIKRYELRKTRPSQDGARRVWLCQSGTSGRIVAAFTCREWVDLSDMSDTQVAKLGCVTAAEVRGYRRERDGRLYGWRIEDFAYFMDTEKEKHIVDFGINRPSQSWQYVRVPFTTLYIE